MRVKLGLTVAGLALAVLGFIAAGAIGAPSDRSGCHGAHGESLTYYCRSAGGSGTTATIPTTAPEPTTTTTLPASGLVLPDPNITPGALNPAVHQSTIHKTICVVGWTKTVRPPVTYTNNLKIAQMTQYGETGSPSEYEEDHFIPLELGGAPRNPKNLWPEPHPQSRVTDPLETKLKHQVCKGAMTLAKARATISQFKFANG